MDFFIAARAVSAASPPLDIHYVAEYFYNIADAGYPGTLTLASWICPT